ncbi:MAG: DUF917 family protein [Actinomycetota bacterium]
MTAGVDLSPSRHIGIDEIDALSAGASVFACGGGGSMVQGRIIVSQLAARLGSTKIGLVSLDELPDSARVAAPLALDRPRTVASVVATVKAFEALGARTGGPFDAVLAHDLGVVSSLLACSVAADLGIPVVDAGGGLRAAGHFAQTTWAAAGIHPERAVVSDGVDITTYEADSLALVDRSLRTAVDRSPSDGPIGGASWAMRGATARRASVPGLLSAAITAGLAIEASAHHSSDPVTELVRVIDGAVLAGRGRVTRSTLALDGTEHVEIEVETASGPLSVLSVDSHLQLLVEGRRVAGAPDLITIVTPSGLGCTPRDLTVPAMEGEPVAVIAAPFPDLGVRVDAAAFATLHRALGAAEDPIPFQIA